MDSITYQVVYDYLIIHEPKEARKLKVELEDLGMKKNIYSWLFFIISICLMIGFRVYINEYMYLIFLPIVTYFGHRFIRGENHLIYKNRASSYWLQVWENCRIQENNKGKVK